MSSSAASDAMHDPDSDAQNAQREESKGSNFRTPIRKPTHRPRHPSRTPMRLSRFVATQKSRQLPPFRPHLGDRSDPHAVRADELLTSQHFEIICAQAMQLACVIPVEPPQLPWLSFQTTPIHQWYESLIVEFANAFAKQLEQAARFPTRVVFGEEGMVTVVDDIDAFNTEACAHINYILFGFHIDVENRPLGSFDNLGIDGTQPNAGRAARALQETTQTAEWPPREGWKMGEVLHISYRRRLWMFRQGVLRLIQESPQDVWILAEPTQLERGVAAYAEWYMAHLREELLAARSGPFLR